jgi:hypothetical protein
MVDERVERLLLVVTKRAKKWLNDGYERKVKIEIRLPDFEKQEPKGRPGKRSLFGVLRLQ